VCPQGSRKWAAIRCTRLPSLVVPVPGIDQWLDRYGAELGSPLQPFAYALALLVGCRSASGGGHDKSVEASVDTSAKEHPVCLDAFRQESIDKRIALRIVQLAGEIRGHFKPELAELAKVQLFSLPPIVSIDHFTSLLIKPRSIGCVLARGNDEKGAAPFSLLPFRRCNQKEGH
jgi:hypothetical protein